MEHVNIALLGMGRIGKIHFKNITQRFPRASVVAVADPQLDEAQFASQYGQGARFFRNPEEAIGHPQVNAVLICTPTSSHADLVEKAATAGKAIFCEKPLDLSLERTAALVDRTGETGVKLMLGFNRRFDPDFMQARQSVAAGKIGEVHIVKITSRDPGLPPIDYIKNSGGLFMDMAIHDFDMARYISGKKVVEVYAKGLVRHDPAVADAGDIDTALTTLVFEDGTCAVIDNSRKAVYGYDQRLEVFGSNGMIQVENNQHHRNIISDAAGIHHALPLDFFMDRYEKSYLKEIELFIDALLHNKEMPVSGSDGLQATLIATAAKLSMQKGEPVKLAGIEAGILESI
ncbi:MAG: inositol 2-dehydrogenase [Williamsia sp.]|nr:inositol 2-dehydrogenase [Williamsia sp.]